MSSNLEERAELAIWKEIASETMSVSHDHWHIDRVLSFARQLQAVYGGDPQVIVAAVLLHDLGRSDSELHGQNSINKSIAQARSILARANFPAAKTEQVITAINEHDKPEVRPSTIEGRILKEADYLGGFGAWGILRIGLWAGETSGGVAQVLDRIERRMPDRLANLEFAESARLAREEVLFTRLFLSLLRQPPQLPTRPKNGKYLVVEGISGSGKDTLAGVLQKRLQDCGHTVVRVNEPANVYRLLRDAWRTEHGMEMKDPVIMKFLLMADRYELMQEEVWPALEKGHTVLSVRNFVSTLVYQCKGEADIAATAFAHQFAPLPDLLLLLDLGADTALSRIKDREKRGIYERPELLEMHRKSYREICEWLFAPQLRVIDASGLIDDVGERAWNAVESATWCCSGNATQSGRAE